LPPGSSTSPVGLVSITSPRLISAATWPQRCAA
jgi:hypothetical protein